MPYQLDTEIEINVDVTNFSTKKAKPNYIISSLHRRQDNSNKSIWTISPAEEVDCFIRTVKEGWINRTNEKKKEAWGLKPNNRHLDVIGKNNKDQELKLAKFVDGDDKDVWHGYPADYRNKSNDRPPEDILRRWIDKKYIDKRKMVKIRSGKSCSL